MKQIKTILSIETSCDETAASVLVGDITAKTPTFSILSNVVKSQIPEHAKMGGVVPEVAARAHIRNILPVVQKALRDAFPDLTPSNFAEASTVVKTIMNESSDKHFSL